MANLAEKVLCIEVLEKISRMQRFLRLEPDVARQQDKEIVGIFSSALSSVLDNTESVLRRLSQNIELEKWEKFSTVRRLSEIFKSVDELHAQLQFIHNTWLRPETKVFITNVCQFIPEDRRPKIVSAILSNNYMFEENDLSFFFQSMLRNKNLMVTIRRETPTVFLPKIERDNPLNWANLVHECGHADYEGIRRLLHEQQIIPEHVDVSTKDILSHWAEEIYCDIFATLVLGPAYLASFATFALVSGKAGYSSESHPSDIVRICILRNVLEKYNLNILMGDSELGFDDLASFFYYIVEERTKLDRKLLYQVSPVPPLPQLHINLHDFVDIISEKLLDLMTLSRYLTAKDFSRVVPLSFRLKKGIPIASYRDPATGASKENTKAEISLDEIKKSVQETRSLPWEIINAGWLHKVKEIYPKAFALFFNNDGNSIHQKMLAWGEELESTDRLLLKSIESAEIHRLIEENRRYGTV